MTEAERRALVNQIITYQEHTLRLFDRLRGATPWDHPTSDAVLAADRAQRAAQQATIAIGKDGE